MQRVQKTVLMIIAAAFAASSAFALQDGASAEKGKALFNDPRLGTTGKSCNSCHVDGKGLENAGARSDLASTINGCITVSLKGKAIDPKSSEMKSLVLYIKGLGEKKPAAKKKAPAGC